MRILVIADPKIPVPPAHYGGAERIVDLLCAGLVQMGHTVDLLAGPGSNSYGGRLRIHHSPKLSYLSRAYRKIRFQFQSLAAAYPVDIVVNFGRLDYLLAVGRTGRPFITVFQNPTTQSELDYVAAKFGSKYRFVGISRAQVKELEPAGRIDVIANGTDMDMLPFRPSAEEHPYLAFLGRLTANKGVHLAIAAARRAGVRLKIAGTESKESGGPEYFAEEVLAKLGNGIDYVGPVDDIRKADLFGGAKAMLFPVQWAEPFGIVMAEALSCGCPIIGWSNGSVPEVIKHGETGFIVDSVDGMVEAIGKIGSIDRAACRADAEARFSQKAMVAGYLRVIDKLMAESQGKPR